MKKTNIFIIILFLPIFIFGSESSIDLFQKEDINDPIREIISYLNKNDFYSFSITCKNLRHAMPDTLLKKIKNGLHKRCTFLTSIYEKDYDAVKWILKYDKGYQKEPPINEMSFIDHSSNLKYDLYSNRFFYYSLCINEYHTQYITPLMVANYIKDQTMLTILKPLEEDLLNASLLKEKTKYLSSDQINYELCMEACLNNININSNNNHNLIKQIKNFNLKNKNDSFHVDFLLLISLINNNNDLQSIVKKNVNFGIVTYKYKDYLGSFFKCIIGVGYGTGIYICNNEIENLIINSFLSKSKNECFTAICDFMGHIGRVYDCNFPHCNKIYKILEKNGAKKLSNFKIPIEKIYISTSFQIKIVFTLISMLILYLHK